MLMMGLRLAEGIDPRRFAALAGAPLRADRVAELAELGLVEAARRAAARHAAPGGRCSTRCCGGCSPDQRDSIWQRPSSSSRVA